MNTCGDHSAADEVRKAAAAHLEPGADAQSVDLVVSFMEIDATAYHEAGHAVACIVLGIPVRSVTITSGSEEAKEFGIAEGTQGCTRHAHPLGRRVRRYWGPRSVSEREKLVDGLIVGYAGGIAERRSGASVWQAQSEKGDIEDIEAETFPRITVSQHVGSAFQALARAQAEEIVELYWPQIREVAVYLIECGPYLSGKGVATIFREVLALKETAEHFNKVFAALTGAK